MEPWIGFWVYIGIPTLVIALPLAFIFARIQKILEEDEDNG